MIALTCSYAFGQTQYKVLWSFGSPNDGATPLSELVTDRSGNLYGTTKFGGSTLICATTGGCGTVFELSPTSDGSWTETILYSFCSNFGNNVCLDGAFPLAGLIRDANGNLYGTTSSGGPQPCQICGTVFALSPPSSTGGQWTESVLYGFCTNGSKICADGAVPTSRLARDAGENIYGTTSEGGSGHSIDANGGGVVFELSRGTDGWTEAVLYNFCTLGEGNFCPDGAAPQAGLTFDKVGNVYGTTEFGGSQNSEGGGTLYKLTPGANGWTETVLKTGSTSTGAPLGTVSVDPSGNLYTTFSAGGISEEGGLLRVGPRGGATTFSFNGKNGQAPAAGVIIDTSHPGLYGTTSFGGTGFGNVFKMVAPAQETILYNFCSQPNCADGSLPMAALIEDKSGNLYGTTKLGGINNQGVVFEIVQTFPKQKPSQRPPVWHTILPSKK